MKYYVEFYDSVETIRHATIQPGLGMMEVEITHPVTIGQTIAIEWTLDAMQKYKWISKLPSGPYKVYNVLCIPGVKEIKVEVYPAENQTNNH
ncbi:hypothetical protein BWI93_03845 [Siphonobacter sp. BAB-5385]|uniref:hypothetical protein n=1 Tax=Siphonobacter sp. BAB-5385 TaxID=1864822 RepID=UPI000B9E751B|nr:hypothetical protein [Siphonobacter sp. BAB-5385]OZI09449.1 hypothetical protein BWI93_03845 [Siphonobacter sp. BAB-5385]